MNPATVAYQGRPGAFSELAARGFLHRAAQPLPCATFASVIDAVVNGLTMYGVLPVHNTLAGVVRESCRLLAGAPVVVLDELALPISHALIGLPSATLSALRSVRSHPVALAQCRRFLRAHPIIVPVQYADTAGAVEYVMRRADPGAAAIAGVQAAALCNAKVLAAGIEDCANNHTLFLLFTHADSRGPYGEFS